MPDTLAAVRGWLARSARAGCGDCPVGRASAHAGDRREFLRRGAIVLAGLGMHPLAGLRAVAALSHDGRAEERRYPIPVVDSVSIDGEGSVILARPGHRVFAFSLACPHQSTALRWNAADREFRCPRHRSRYRADGTFIDGRATRAMDRLAIRREAETVVVDLDIAFEQDRHPAQWAGAVVLL